MAGMRKNIISQYGLQVAKYLFPFITLPYLTRVLGPDVYAVRAYMLSVMSFMLVFLDYGFTLYGTRVVALHADNHKLLQEDISRIFFMRIGLCLLGAVILACITPFVAIMYENIPYLVAAYIGTCFKAALPDFIFQGLEDMGIITQRFVGSQTVSTLLILLLIHHPNDLLWVPIFEGIASLIALVWSWDNVLRVRKIYLVTVPLQSMVYPFKESTIFFLSSAATTVFNAFTTIMLGAYISSPAQISYWSISMTAISAVQSLYTPITNTMYPHMVKSRDYKLLRKFLIIGMCIVTVGTISFALASKLIMLVLGGAEYTSGSYILVLLAPVLWFSFPAMLIGFPLLGAIGKTRELTASSVFSAVFHILGLIILGFSGHFTIVNVAILRCCTEAIMLVLRIVFAKRSVQQQVA